MTEDAVSAMTVSEVFKGANLSPHGPVGWRTEISEHCAGVYVIALTKEAKSSTSVLVDVSNLDEHEQQHWFPNEVVVYIGQTSKQTLATRIHQFYVHVYGSKSPHRGGQAVHLLGCDSWVYWAPTPDPKGAEGKMMDAFVERAGHLPFANRRR